MAGTSKGRDVLLAGFDQVGSVAGLFGAEPGGAVTAAGPPG